MLSAASTCSACAGITQFYDSSDGITFQFMKDHKSKPLQMLRLFCDNPTPIGAPINEEVNYEMLTGKRHNCWNFYEEHQYLLADKDTLTIRLYNDGFAWKKKGPSTIELVKPEHTWLQEWTDAYENFFPKDRELKEGLRIGYPALIQYNDSIFGLLTESGITPEEAGTSMYALGDNRFELKPDGPEDGGWQTFIAGSLADVVESSLVTDIAAPNKLQDTSWIEPGVASWVYWAYNHGSNDYEIIKKYVDMAEELKLPYVLIDAEWDEMKDGKTIEDAVAYAVSKCVKQMIWYN